MRSILRLIIFAAAASSLPAAAQNVCPCVPLTYLWTVTTCTDWTCAATELAVANGDPATFALPIGINDHRWLVVRRMTAGTGVLPPADDPFQIETFVDMPTASARFLNLPHVAQPMLMTAPDGSVLVISLRSVEPKHRAAGR